MSVEIKENFEIKNETTFKIGGIVKKAAFPSNIDELSFLLNTGDYDIVLGNCSNILCYSGFIDKNIIFTKNMNNFSFDKNILTAEAGCRGPVLSRECEKRGLSGFEFLIGFPGSIGGMIFMNASAHNQCISDVVKDVIVYDSNSKKVLSLDKDELDFKYRHSRLKEDSLILLSARFEFIPGEIETISEMTRRNIKFRQEHQPSLSFGNAGSVFRNPPNDSAGRLLDLCGLKGNISGGAKVFDNHANFIINFDNATSSDVINLMYKMYSEVKDKYGICLKPEIIFIGNEKTKEYELWREMTEENIQTTQK